MDKQFIIDKLKVRYANLTANQKKIAKYIFDHYESASFMSAKRLAEAVGVSDATVIRFATAAGFADYTDMTKNMRADVIAYNEPETRINKSLGIIHNQKNLFKQILNCDIDNLMKFSKEFDVKRIQQAVDEIYKAKRIFLMGIGTSSLLTTFLHMHLRRMGFDVLSVSENTMFDYEKMLLIRKSDLLIACSTPRYARSTLSAAHYAKKKKARVIAITDSEFAPISVSSNILLRINVDNITFFHSWLVGMELCNFLLMSVLERQGEQMQATLKENCRNIDYFYQSNHSK